MGESLHKCDLLKAGGLLCATCDEVLTSKENLEIHIDQVHKVEKDKVDKDKVDKDKVEQDKDNVDKMIADLLSKVDDTKALVQLPVSSKETVPAPKHLNIAVKKYLAKHFPGCVEKWVKGDGACLTQSSVIHFLAN